MTRRRTRRHALLMPALLLTLAGCDEASEPLAPDYAVAGGVQGSATGGGFFTVGGALEVQFSMSAIQLSADGAARGRAHHSVEFEGDLVEFHTEVTCVPFDEENGRAWIGGTITQNNSNHPFWTTGNNDVGDAIWWRVVDYGEGGNAPEADRSTFVGFEGNAGIITSREYCDAQIWPEGDARTSPVTEGEIQVRVR